jgi:hypothetical protein
MGISPVFVSNSLGVMGHGSPRLAGGQSKKHALLRLNVASRTKAGGRQRKPTGYYSRSRTDQEPGWQDRLM